MRPVTPSDRYVPWACEMPRSWEPRPLKYCVRINSNVLSESTDGRYEFRYIDIGTVTSHGRITEPAVLTFDEAPSRARRVVQHGDTIISTVRTYLKAIAFIDEDANNLVCSTGFAVLRPRPFVCPKFLFYWVRSSFLVDEICARSVGVSYPAINALEIGCLPFPMLNCEHQRDIASYLDAELSRVDAMIDRATSLISSAGSNGGMFADYRDALITAAVMGKIDVGSEASNG